jgi:recombination protein RecA
MEIIDFAIEKNIIAKKGSWFYFGEEKLAQGQDATKKLLVNNPALFLQLKEEVLK